MKIKRPGFSVAEFLVVVVVVLLLVVLLLPAVIKVREAARAKQAAAAAAQANQTGSQVVVEAPVLVTIPDVYDSDDRLAIDGSNEAIVLYFYSRFNEQCSAQKPVLNKVAAKWNGKVKFVKVDYMSNSNSSTNIMHLVLYNVHHTPTFILRRKGDTRYRTRIGVLSEEALNTWVTEGLKSSADQ